VSEPQAHGVRRIVMLGVVIYLSILLKTFGLVLVLSCPLYFLWHLSTLRAAHVPLRGLVLTAMGVFAVIAALVLLSWTGHHPLSRLEGEGGGVGQYATGELMRSMKGTWVALGLALLVQFQVGLAFGLSRAAWKRDMLAPLVCFGGIAGLMPFPTTFYNMRYLVPLFPLLALVLVRGMAAFRPVIRRTILGAHAVVGALLIVVFNFVPAYRIAEPVIPVLEVNWIGTPLSLLDNLRMRLHLQQADVLENIEREVPAGATLYVMDVAYYRDAQQGVYERAGLIRSDSAIHYVSRREFHPAEKSFYVWSFFPEPPLDQVGRVTDLGHSLYHVEKSG
jgi:hypothetical protein